MARNWSAGEGKPEFTIEKVPLPPAPPKSGRGKGVSKYPMAQLELGESFVVTGVKKGTVSTMITKAGKDLGRKFVVRAVAGGFRIARVEPKVPAKDEDED